MMTMTTTTERPTNTRIGFDLQYPFNHKETGTRYNPAGYDIHGFDIDGFNRLGFTNGGFDRQGIHRNGTSLDDKGFDIHGADRDGWQTRDWYAGDGLTAQEWLLRMARGRFDDSLLPIHRETGTIYGPDGFHYFDFDAFGYDRDGFSRGGDSGVSVMTDREGFYRSGFNERGFARDGYNARGLDNLGFTRERLHSTTGTVWTPDGIHALTGTGYGPDGYDKHGYDNKGYGRDGFAYNGFNADRIHKETGTYFGPDERTVEGLDRNGFTRSMTTDAFGYEKGKSAPSRVYILAGWNHRILAEKLKYDDTDYQGQVPRNLYREGWRHEAGQGFEIETGLLASHLAFTHKDTGTRFNPEGFTVLGLNPDTRLNERGFNVDTGIHSVTGGEFDAQGWNYHRTELATR